MRIGFGYDVHRLVAGRPLILGGVRVPYEYGLLGHSDADVLLHAIADALLGTIAARDIGFHFPDTDEKWKNADSKIILQIVGEMVKNEKYKIANIDSTICAQKPKLSPYIPDMQQVIAKILNILPTQISVKATTTEHLGFEGREEGISASAIVLLEKL